MKQVASPLGHRGFSLIEMMLAISMASVITLSFATLYSQVVRSTQLIESRKSVIELRAKVFDDLFHPLAVENTTNHPTNQTVFGCVTGTGTCSPGLVQLFDASTPPGRPVGYVAPPKPSTKGVDDRGLPCDDFNPKIGNPRCPYQTQLSAKVECVGCPDLVIRWTAAFSYNPGSRPGEATPNTNKWDAEVLAGYPWPSLIDTLGTGRNTTCALYKDGRLKCWGGDEDGVLGRGTIDSPSGTPGYVVSSAGTPLSGIKQVQVSNQSSCALMNDGRVMCWGSNGRAQLGRGRLPKPAEKSHSDPHGRLDNSPLPGYVKSLSGSGPALMDLQGVSRIYGGEIGHCAQRSSGILCWGNAYKTWRPLPSSRPTKKYIYEEYKTPPPEPSVRFEPPTYTTPGKTFHDSHHRYSSIAYPLTFTNLSESYDFHTGPQGFCMTIGANDEVNCWGAARAGLLGSTNLTPGPAMDEELDRIFDFHPNRRIPPVGVYRDANELNPTSALSNVFKLAFGDEHRCAVLSDRRAVCWGENDKGQLGRGSVSPNQTPMPPGFVIDPNTMNPMTDIEEISAGSHVSCAKKLNGSVWCWGRNDQGQTGSSTLTCIKENSMLWCPTGATALGQGLPSQVNLPGPAERVATGDRHACAHLESQEVWCWGGNSMGQLGQGTVGSPTFSSDPLKVEGL